MVKFILNNQEISANQAHGSTLLDYIRYHQNLNGTKIGCREGDCGACTVLIGDYFNDRLSYRSVTSCLMPLSNAHGKHVVTVEGLNLEELNVVQKSIVDQGGTQCGFCTAGFVVSLCGFCLSDQKKNYENAIAAIDGNICRCTGYKSLERAARVILDQLTAGKIPITLRALVENGFIPEYFFTIKKRLAELHAGLPELSNAKSQGNGQVKIGGGTDLYVQRPESLAKSELHNLKHNGKSGSWEGQGKIYFGSTSTAEDLRSSLLIAKLVPRIKDFMKLVASTQIRNMGTIAGNFINASPIGDLTIFFLAWDATIVLNKDDQQRQVKLRDLYRGYKQLDLKPGEIIHGIYIDIPADKHFFNFEKVSKRTHLDIASVNSACYLEIEANQIVKARISAGGVAPIPLYLAGTSQFLIGRTLSEDTLIEANEIVQQEISPISDVRGSSDYKRLLLRQLLYAHFLTFFPQKLEPEALLC